MATPDTRVLTSYEAGETLPHTFITSPLPFTYSASGELPPTISTMVAEHAVPYSGWLSVRGGARNAAAFGGEVTVEGQRLTGWEGWFPYLSADEAVDRVAREGERVLGSLVRGRDRRALRVMEGLMHRDPAFVSGEGITLKDMRELDAQWRAFRAKLVPETVGVERVRQIRETDQFRGTTRRLVASLADRSRGPQQPVRVEGVPTPHGQALRLKVTDRNLFGTSSSPKMDVPLNSARKDGYAVADALGLAATPTFRALHAWKMGRI